MKFYVVEGGGILKFFPNWGCSSLWLCKSSCCHVGSGHWYDGTETIVCLQQILIFPSIFPNGKTSKSEWLIWGSHFVCGFWCCSMKPKKAGPLERWGTSEKRYGFNPWNLSSMCLLANVCTDKCSKCLWTNNKMLSGICAVECGVMWKCVLLIESLWFSLSSLSDYLWECTGIHFYGRKISAPEFY